MAETRILSSDPPAASLGLGLREVNVWLIENLCRLFAPNLLSHEKVL
jgi:hypothetical protein